MSQRSTKRRQGFTLIEVLLVLVILVILAGMAVPAYQSIQKSANMRAAKAQIGLFMSALEAYRMDIGDYPATGDGLDALRQAPASLGNARGSWPYLKKNVPADPWGRAYQYEYPGRNSPDTPDIWSMGPDGVNGSDDDIVSWVD